MGFLLLLLIPFFIGIFFWYAKIHIDWGSLPRRTLPLDRGLFGVYCFTGKQGSGKTYSLVKYIKKHVKDGQDIYSNVTMPGVKYFPITSVEHLLSLRDKKKVFIVYDEIFTLMQKSSKIDGELMEFLTQQRKMKNILFTTAQEWLEVPVTFRRFVRIQVACKTRPLGRLGGILEEEYFDAYAMKWDNLENEYIAPRLSKKFSKYEKRYMESYDTYERIRKLANKEVDVKPSSDTAGGFNETYTATSTPIHPKTQHKPPQQLTHQQQHKKINITYIETEQKPKTNPTVPTPRVSLTSKYN